MSAGGAVNLYRTPQLNGWQWGVASMPSAHKSALALSQLGQMLTSLALMRFGAMEKVSHFNKIRNNSVFKPTYISCNDLCNIISI